MTYKLLWMIGYNDRCVIREHLLSMIILSKDLLKGKNKSIMQIQY